MTYLLIDAGGTYVRSAILSGNGALGAVTADLADDFPSFEEAVMEQAAQSRERLHGAVLSVAGPVQGDHVAFTNRSWAFSQSELKAKLGVQHVVAMNDFAALALSLPHLSAEDVETLAPGQPPPRTAKVVLGPGTGLGVAAAVPAGDTWIAVPGEGGHVAASLDGLVPERAQRSLWESGWLPWEEVLSGRGLLNLHRALQGEELSDPAQITQAAQDGDGGAQRTLSAFSALLGRRASDAALQAGAWGGVYLAGGIVPKLGDLFYRAAFRDAFETKGVYQDLVRQIPIYLIRRPDPVFLGLAATARSLD